MLTDIKLIILDRDGVINADSAEYIKSPEEFHPLPGSLEAIAALNHAGFLVTVATNQSGVGRGYYSLETLEAMHAKMNRLLSEQGGHIDALMYCPHVPEDHCTCRKPKSGMIKEILSRYPEIAPNQVLMIGDSLRDLEAAWEEHCQAVLVRTGKGVATLEKHLNALDEVQVFDDLAQVTSVLCEKNGSPSP
jgi:D-glycero-D-manno-heptose 1,7-bisphosphate phosphatase